MTVKTYKIKPGRKPLTSLEPVGPQFVGKTPEADAKQEIALRERLDHVNEQFGDGLPYVREHYQAEIRRDMTSFVESTVSAGRKLIVMKAHEAHGNWLICLREMGLGENYAQRMMAAARRIAALSNAAPAQHLLLSAGTPSKLFDMLALSDDEIEKIADGEGPIDPANVEHMTRSELREALREARADKAALEDRNAKLSTDTENAKLAEAKAKRTWQAATLDDQLKKLSAELDEAALLISTAIGSKTKTGEKYEKDSTLRRRVAAVVEHCEEHGLDRSVHLAGVFAQLERHLHLVRDEFFIPHVAVGDPALEAQAMIQPRAS